MKQETREFLKKYFGSDFKKRTPIEALTDGGDGTSNNPFILNSGFATDSYHIIKFLYGNVETTQRLYRAKKSPNDSNPVPIDIITVRKKLDNGEIENIDVYFDVSKSFMK